VVPNVELVATTVRLGQMVGTFTRSGLMEAESLETIMEGVPGGSVVANEVLRHLGGSDWGRLAHMGPNSPSSSRP
jgi:hypothetical protein